MALARAVRRRRLKLGLTQEQVADAARIVPRHYQKLEAGEVNFSLKTLIRMADALDCDVANLFKGS